jgi:hypothetical protein
MKKDDVVPAREVRGQAGGEGVENASDVDGVAADVGPEVAIAERGREFCRVGLLRRIEKGSGVDPAHRHENDLI